MTGVLHAIRELVFPRLRKPTAQEEQAAQKQLQDDRLKIAGLSFNKNPEAALDEARRVADAEAARRSGADQKAAAYLAVVAALVPLILTVATAVWDEKAGSAPTWINMMILCCAIIYVSRAGVWAFRVLEVSASNRLGILDFEAAWAKPEPIEHLTRSLLMAARLNHDPVNRKVSRISMAHAFLLRAFLSFALLLLFNIAWYLGEAANEAAHADPWLGSTDAALAASVHVAKLREEIGQAQSATTVLDRWCVSHGMAAAGGVSADLLADRPAPAPLRLKQLLALGPNDHLQFREVRLRCGKHALSAAKLWYVPTRLPPEIEARLHRSRVPFGRAVSPLGLGRISLASTAFWPSVTRRGNRAMPGKLFRQEAILKHPDGMPVAYVTEDYLRGILGFDVR